MTGGESNLAERAGEAEAVEKAERERDEPGPAGGDASLALAGTDDLGGDEDDRQRDRRLDRGGGTLTKPSVAAASVMLCATVKAVIARMSCRVLGAIRMRASTKSR